LRDSIWPILAPLYYAAVSYLLLKIAIVFHSGGVKIKRRNSVTHRQIKKPWSRYVIRAKGLSQLPMR